MTFTDFSPVVGPALGALAVIAGALLTQQHARKLEGDRRAHELLKEEDKALREADSRLRAERQAVYAEFLSACDVVLSRLRSAPTDATQAVDTFWSSYYRVRLIGSEHASSVAYDIGEIVRALMSGKRPPDFERFRSLKGEFGVAARGDLGTLDTADRERVRQERSARRSLSTLQGQSRITVPSSVQAIVTKAVGNVPPPNKEL